MTQPETGRIILLSLQKNWSAGDTGILHPLSVYIWISRMR